MVPYSEIHQCRICGNPRLLGVLNLGEQHLTGVFPRSRDAQLTRGPLELVLCSASPGHDHCGLLQLRHSYPASEMYGLNYGYRSALNRSMVSHLEGIVERLTRLAPVQRDDLVIDIGSNDGTLLSFYPEQGPLLVGIDPTGEKFARYYRPDIQLIPDFFNADLVRKRFGDRKARIVTSIAMFYDLDRPMDFMSQVRDVLAPDGVWLFEQSYMPAMLEANAYDTICHEHVEYYGLHQIKYMTDRCGLKIIDVRLNDVNGGSFAVAVARKDSRHTEDEVNILRLLRREHELGLDTVEAYEGFRAEVFHHREKLNQLLADLRGEGKRVIGYGASTKGNVILQFCGIGPEQLPCIAEVNPDKFGCFTPGTGIPIVSEAQAKAGRPTHMLVLPWHFRENLLRREAEYLSGGGTMIFPLPHLEMVTRP
ncbi:MAG: methyltransferase domain-containing protein [Phycisphaeraceae bacterium]|nr:methyltransferase domain-containing protein [Phycisphaeraceae bacterium]